MIPPGYAAAVYAWAISPELSDDAKAERSAALLAERDALITGGVTSGGKGLRDMVSGAANGKSFAFAPSITSAEKLTILTDVLDRLGLVAEDARAITTTHAVFPCLQR